MENKCKVVLLNTVKEPKKGDILLRHLWKDTKIECKSLWQYNETVVIQDVKQYTTLNGSFRDIYTSFVPQHIYILSDDEIKEGDWFIWDNDDSIQKAVSDSQAYTDCYGKGSFSINMCAIGKEAKKIIATTNPDLIKEGIASIDDEFIKQYCDNPIEEVNVEYEYKENINERIYGKSIVIGDVTNQREEPKLSSNGSIIIKPIEETWEEVINYYLN